MLSDRSLTKGKGVRLGIATPTGNSTPSNLALTHAAGQLGVSAQNALAASAAKHYEGRGAVRAALGRGNPELSGLVPAVTAPDSLTIRSGSLRRMSRRPGAKGRRDRLSSVFQLPDYGVRACLRGRTADTSSIHGEDLWRNQAQLERASQALNPAVLQGTVCVRRCGQLAVISSRKRKLLLSVAGPISRLARSKRTAHFCSR